MCHYCCYNTQKSAAKIHIIYYINKNLRRKSMVSDFFSQDASKNE